VSAYRERRNRLLDMMQLTPFRSRLADRLSGGMKQKLALACTLVHEPALILLDEPTTGVDPVTRQDFWQLIIRLVAQEGVAVLVSTPYMDEAARCERVGFMRKGIILVEGRPDELRASLNGRILEVHGEPLTQLRELARGDGDVEDAQLFGDRLHLRVKPGATERVMHRLEARATGQGGRLSSVRSITPQLEDVFINLLEVQAGGDQPTMERRG
jgi:ABC-2 type transport system ATP-binding protein